MGDQASVSSRPSPSSIFGEDGKLSSASAATALKYARPQDLPSYPSTGGVQLSSAGAAANLANNNQKPFEYWKPGAIPTANKAAMLAKDYTMQPLWQPGSTKAGNTAARMAHANPTEVGPLQHPTPRNKAQSAAETMHSRQRAASMSSQQAQKPKDDNSWALKAAAKSHKDGASTPSAASVSGDPSSEAARIQNAPKDDGTRQLYTSNPPVGMDAKEKQRQDMLKASAIAMARKMFLIQQQHIDEAAGRTTGSKQANRPDGSIMGASSYYASDNLSAVGGGYENLEEAARRLAQARLAKIHDEHAEYRQYYGAQPSTPPRSRLSVRLRRRTSANARDRDDDSDEEQSRRIRSQMSIFQSKLAEVDNKKRQQDRDALLVIAHRNVDAQISKLDEKVFQETGKASPAQMEKWERAAREKAQRDSDERMQHTGKVHIGGGKYIDQSELDAIARARLQPTLDDIAYKADQQRARDEETRAEKAKKEQETQAEKTRAAAAAAEAKVASAKLKVEERALKDLGKREQKEASAAEKQRRRESLAAEKERERLEKEEQRKLNPERPGRLSTFLSRGSSFGKKDTMAGATEPGPRDEADTSDDSRSDNEDEAEPATFHDEVTEPTAGSADAVVTTTENDVDPVSIERPSADRTTSLEKTTSLDEEKEGTTSPTKNKSRVKSWMRVRFRSKSGSQMPVVAEQDTDESKAVKQESGNDEAAAKDSSRPESMRDVAMAGRASNESDDLYGPPREVSPPGSKGSQDKASRDRSASISSLSSHYSEHNKDAKSEEAVIGEAKAVELKPQTSQEPSESEGDGRGRSGFKARLLRKITPQKTAPKDDKAATPATTNATNENNEGNEEFEEARDTFEEEKSAPPQPSSTAVGENKEENGVQKTVSPKASRERSRFTEDL